MKIKTLRLVIGAAAILLAISSAPSFAQERHDRYGDRDQVARD